MELFNKLKKILFDEVTTEIPVITKDEKKSEVLRDISTKNVNEESPKKRVNKENEEVIIQKIETPKREKKVILPDDEGFDMPKLKEEAREEVQRSSFTFPVFEDDDKEIVMTKRREKKEESVKQKQKETTSNTRRKETGGGYNNAFDYSYGKYKGDYKSNRDHSHEVLTKTRDEERKNKTFTPSPIISPVYGVLNENYKKEDIVSKKEVRVSSNSSTLLDLDSVRKKAYGTLEDEIESSLSRDFSVFDMEEDKRESDFSDEDIGISIDDLLIDADDIEVQKSGADIVKEEDMELFRTNDAEPLMAGADVIDQKEEKKFDKTPPAIKDLGEDILKLGSEENKQESLGEEDLFDLIDSLYQGKGEE